jgi:predicted choloylglycine hydrolase
MQSVEFSGTWKEIGRAHGEQLGHRLREVEELVTAEMLPLLRTDESALQEDARFNALKAHAPAWFWEELKSLRQTPRGDEVTEESLLLANVVDDLSLIALRQGEARASAMACTSFAVHNGDGPLVARNLDYFWGETLTRLQQVFRITPEENGALPIVSVGWPGYLGVVTGMNSEGVCLAVHVSDPVNVSAHGIPSGMLYRQTLHRARTAREAADVIASASRTAGYNVLLADPREVLVLEVTAQQAVVRTMRDGFLTCSNHFQSRELGRAAVKDLLSLRYPLRSRVAIALMRVESLRRASEVAKWLKRNAVNDVETARAGLCQRAVEKRGTLATVQTVFFEPAARRMWVADATSPPTTRGRLRAVDARAEIPHFPGQPLH